MFSICKNFIKINDDLFLVKKIFAEDRVKNIEPIKEWLDADSVYKKDGALYFCSKIIELEVVN
jgi:hypothetical protein